MRNGGLQIEMQMFFSKYVTSPRLHEFIYRLTRGAIGSRLPGVQPGVLLLTVQGRRTGKPRTTPLVHFQLDDQIVVAATNNGADHHPAWYWNLKARPYASIQIGSSNWEVKRYLPEGAERQRLWTKMTKIHPLFAAYQERTDREIPVVVLEPA